MQLLLLIICFLFFLFVFYVFAREDHIFYRRNVTLEMVFDISFIGLLVVTFFSRFVYVVLNPKWVYLNPLALLLFPYFPGLSLGGGILGGVFYCIYISHKKKIPTGRLLDIVCLSFLLTFCFGILLVEGMGFVTRQHGLLFPALESAIFLLGFIILTIVFTRNRWKDGKVSLVILLLISVVSIAETILVNQHMNIFLLKENYLFVVLIFLAVMLLMNDKGRRNN